MPNVSSRESRNCFIAADVGGTNTRVGLFESREDIPSFMSVETYSNKEFPGLESILEKFLETRKAKIDGACFGVAGPVENGRCRATNLPWEVSEDNLKKTFSWPRVRLINDLEAAAHATRVLTDKDLFVLQAGKPDKDAPRAVIAPGTGLGMSLMVKVKGNWLSLPSEGGHMDFAPNSEEEAQLWRHIRKSTGHVSAERIVSGPGLVNIYKWLLDKNNATPPDWLSKTMEKNDPARVVSEVAVQGKDPTCENALRIFVSILGAVAGNLALVALPFGGLYIGGGIAPKVMPFLEKNHFLRSFSDKGRFRELLNGIPVKVILDPLAALSGAAVYLVGGER